MRIAARNPDLVLRECDKGAGFKDDGEIAIMLAALIKHRVTEPEWRLDGNRFLKFVYHLSSGPKFCFW